MNADYAIDFTPLAERLQRVGGGPLPLNVRGVR
jgi:hypothetical protein